MSRTRLLISLLLLASLFSCSYGFVLEGTHGGEKIALDPSTNKTHLREAGMILDSYLERSFSSMGLLSQKAPQYSLACSIASTSRQRITSESLKKTDRYRLNITVVATLSDTSGKVVWHSTFTDQGTFSEGGQDEDALDEACREISLQIARAVATLSL